MNVAVTGHQDLGTAEAMHWVEGAIEKAVDSVHLTKGYTCLAIGADQLFAKILLVRGIPFVAIIACSGIESSFSTDVDRKSFRRLLGSASETIKLSFDAPSERAYFEAGRTAVDKSDMLIAVWNGRPAKGLGGTGDVVQYAKSTGKMVIHVDLVARKVINLDPSTIVRDS